MPGKWALNFKDESVLTGRRLPIKRNEKKQRETVFTDNASMIVFRNTEPAVEPLGLVAPGKEEHETEAAKKKAAKAELRVKKMWELAKSPFKQHAMNAFMMWMSGSGVHIFSLMITFMVLFNSLKGGMGVHKEFQKYKDIATTEQLPAKLVFVLLHLGGVGLGLYKMSTMGLLPTAASDWINDSIKESAEFMGGGMSLS